MDPQIITNRENVGQIVEKLLLGACIKNQILSKKWKFQKGAQQKKKGASRGYQPHLGIEQVGSSVAPGLPGKRKEQPTTHNTGYLTRHWAKGPANLFIYVLVYLSNYLTP